MHKLLLNQFIDKLKKRSVQFPLLKYTFTNQLKLFTIYHLRTMHSKSIYSSLNTYKKKHFDTLDIIYISIWGKMPTSAPLHATFNEL